MGFKDQERKGIKVAQGFRIQRAWRGGGVRVKAPLEQGECFFTDSAFCRHLHNIGA